MIKIKKLYLRNIVTIVSLFALIIGYCLLQPRISGIFPFMREMRLHTFLNTIKKTNSISAQEFWKFREFYYPGSVIIDRNGISGKVKPLLFFQFNSKYIRSNEYLTNSHNLNLIVPLNEGFIVNKDRLFAYRENKEIVDIIFIKPISEMVKTNGFIYDKDQDKKLVEGKYWLVITKIVR